MGPICKTARMIAASVAVAAALSGPSALAGPLPPGGSVRADFNGPFMPPGTVVARQTFTQNVPLRPRGGAEGQAVRFVGGDGQLTDFTVGLTLENLVLSDPADGTLTFVYTLDTVNDDFGEPNSEFSLLTIPGFAGVAADADGTGGLTVTRSPDGSTITDRLDAAGIGYLPFTLAVKTDATAFDAGGTLDYQFGNEYVVRPVVPEFPDRPDLSNFIGSGNGTADFAGTYRPAASAGGGPAVVPLPAGVWGGGLTLAGAGLLAARRRRRAARCL